MGRLAPAINQQSTTRGVIGNPHFPFPTGMKPKTDPKCPSCNGTGRCAIVTTWPPKHHKCGTCGGTGRQ